MMSKPSWLLSICCSLLSFGAAPVLALDSGTMPDNSKLPSHITLRAGVLHAPPFAIIEENPFDGSVDYSGFQPDLLKRLQIFAQQEDNVTLHFELGQSPSQYGDALDLIANDCNSTHNNNLLEECHRFDLIVGDYYCNPERSLRIDFTPSWLRTTMSTVKFVGHSSERRRRRQRQVEDFTTLTQAATAGATVCVPDGTYLMDVVMGKFPAANYLKCASPDDCVQALEEGDCVLYADDELLLRYRASNNPMLQVTREQFNTQYLVWPLRRDLDPTVALYIKKWMYSAVANATLDELYFKYFQKQLCPVGTAGKDCELPCDPVHGTANSGGVCVCESVKWTGDDCSIEVPENTNLIPDTLKILSYIMIAINFATIILCAVWLFWQRNSLQVRVSQPFFLAMVLVGCGISTSTILAMAQEDKGDDPVHACMAIPWLYSVGFSITFGSLFAKIRRVYSIFKSAATPGIVRKTAVTFQETIAVIGVVLLIDVFVLLAWTIFSPLEWTRVILSEDQFGVSLESQGYCSSDDWTIFASIIGFLHLTLLGVACYMCFMARDIPTKFSEGRYVSIAMISNLQIFVVGVPILIILGASPQSSFFVRSVIIWMNDFVVVSLIFGNLVYHVHFQMEAAEPEAVKAAIGQAIQSFSAARQSEKRASRFLSQQQTSFLHESHTSAQFSFNGNASGNLSYPQSPTQGHPQQHQLPQERKQSSQDRRRSSKHSSNASPPRATPKKEITLTKSQLEENNASLRRGESHRKLADSSHHTRPLPRSLMNSSISTQIQGNIKDGTLSVVNNSSHSHRNLPQSSWADAHLSMTSAALSTASEASLPNRQPQTLDGRSISEGDDDESDHEAVPGLNPIPQAFKPPPATPNAKAVDVLGDERESWGGINLSAHSGHNRRQPDRSAILVEDECADHQTILDTSRTSISSSARLPPANLPQDGPSRLAYAASRINTVRNHFEQMSRELEDYSDLDASGSKLMRASTAKPRDDRTDMDDSKISKHRDRRRSSNSRSCRSSRRSSDASAMKEPELKRASTESSAASHKGRRSSNGAKEPSSKRALTSTSQQRRVSNDGTQPPSLRRTSTGGSAASQKQRRPSSRMRSSVDDRVRRPSSALGAHHEMDVSDPGLYFPK